MKTAKKNGKKFLEKLGELMDDHQEWGEAEGEGKGGDKANTPGKGKPTYTKEELKKIRDEVKEAMVSAAQSTGASNLPGALRRLVSDLTEPKIGLERNTTTTDNEYHQVRLHLDETK